MASWMRQGIARGFLGIALVFSLPTVTQAATAPPAIVVQQTTPPSAAPSAPALPTDKALTSKQQQQYLDQMTSKLFKATIQPDGSNSQQVQTALRVVRGCLQAQLQAGVSSAVAELACGAVMDTELGAQGVPTHTLTDEDRAAIARRQSEYEDAATKPDARQNLTDSDIADVSDALGNCMTGWIKQGLASDDAYNRCWLVTGAYANSYRAVRNAPPAPDPADTSSNTAPSDPQTQASAPPAPPPVACPDGSTPSGSAGNTTPDGTSIVTYICDDGSTITRRTKPSGDVATTTDNADGTSTTEAWTPSGGSSKQGSTTANTKCPTTSRKLMLGTPETALLDDPSTDCPPANQPTDANNAQNPPSQPAEASSPSNAATTTVDNGDDEAGGDDDAERAKKKKEQDQQNHQKDEKNSHNSGGGGSHSGGGCGC
jgi:hypothetical protein